MSIPRFNCTSPSNITYFDVSISQGVGSLSGDKHYLAVVPSALVRAYQIKLGVLNADGSINNDGQMAFIGAGLVDTGGKALSLLIAPPGIPNSVRGIVEDQLRNAIAGSIQSKTTMATFRALIGFYIGSGWCCAALFVTDSRNKRPGEYLNVVKGPDLLPARFMAGSVTRLTITHGTLGLVKTQVDVSSV